MNIDSSRSTECCVCLQPLVNPVKLPCGHTFCFLCVKGAASVSRNCALCRKPFSRELVDKPDVFAHELRDDESSPSLGPIVRHVWYYEGRNGWWMYDQRTNDEIDQAFSRGARRIETLIVGHVYVVDFEHMYQYRLNDTQRRRRIKYDLISAPKKGVAGLKLDISRHNQADPTTTAPSIVPSLASSVPSIIATQSTNSSSSSSPSSPDPPSASRSVRRRSDADGEEPSSSLSVPVLISLDNSDRIPIRQPADGFGNPTTTTITWQVGNNNADPPLMSWSSDDDDDDELLPPPSRPRPVLIGVEDQTHQHRSNLAFRDDDDTLLANLSLNT